MKEEAFFVSIDPHPQGNLRITHENEPFQVWDFETMSEAVTPRWAIGIIDLYCYRSCISKSKIYFTYDALEYIRKRIAAMEEELERYRGLVKEIIIPTKEAAAMRQHNNRRKKKPASDQKPTKV